MECKYLQTIELESPGEGARATSVIGQVVRIHVNDDYITPDGLIDMYKLRPLAGLGYYDYAVIEGSQLFQVKTPDDDRFSGDDSKGWEQAAGVE
jgi:flavin reductase (DIM6/NTAB) family NADH-FMN oxidoreductase RutF